MYERHFDHVRAQMKKMGGHTVSASSAVDDGNAKENNLDTNRQRNESQSTGTSIHPLKIRLTLQSVLTIRQKSDQAATATSGTTGMLHQITLMMLQLTYL